MTRQLNVLAASLLWSLSVASASDRLAVLEFFGRPSGGFCNAAGPSMIALQQELEGQAVLLEYDFDVFNGSQILDRFWATGSQAGYLPIVMVGSGFRTYSGPAADYYQTYSGMIAEERARPPRAEVDAWWRRSGAAVTGYVRLRNTSSSVMRVSESARVWLIVYEAAHIGVSNTWVRTAEERDLTADLAPGETATLEITASAATMDNWQRAAVLVLAEDRPGGGGNRYDMAQAAEARPAALVVTPSRLVVDPSAPTAELVLEGPHVLRWTASTSAEWLEVGPASGVVPEITTVSYRPELRPPGETTATMSFEAAGDGMAFSTDVEITAGLAVRRPSGRVTPDTPPSRR